MSAFLLRGLNVNVESSHELIFFKTFASAAYLMLNLCEIFLCWFLNAFHSVMHILLKFHGVSSERVNLLQRKQLYS